MNGKERTMKSHSTQIDRMLGDESFHIEFHGYLSNHAKHAVIALHGLGATDDDISAYLEDYAKTTYGFGLEPYKPSETVLTEANWRELLGKHEEFDALCRFFQERVRDVGLQETLELYVPELLPGIVGALLHGTIHLGWALDAAHEGMIVEGLAYLAFSYVSCHPSLDSAGPASRATDQTPLATLQRIATEWSRDRLALEGWVDESMEMPELSVAAGFQPVLEHTGAQLSIARVLARGHALIESTPVWAQAPPTEETWKQLYYAISLIYMSKPGDFALLHLLTSLHAVENIARHLPPDGQREAIECYWKAVLGVLFALKAVPAAADLTALHSRYEDSVDPASDATVQSNWASIVERALQEREEHNPKLVYVMRKLWHRFERASVHRECARHFTTTPVLSPDAEYSPSNQGA